MECYTEVVRLEENEDKT